MGEKSRSKGCCGWFIAFVVLAVVVGAIVYTVIKKIGHSDSDKPAPVPGPPGAVDQKYSSALKTSLQFFDIQKCIHSFTSFPLFLFQCFTMWFLMYVYKAFIILLFPFTYANAAYASYFH